ncbi:hypothetical protein HK098_004216 [Nowakowskiella sp. JEL0407]|nr:hypothetical protein HK098_004216 [Nowakowskiella sp. JEL0407]
MADMKRKQSIEVSNESSSIQKLSHEISTEKPSDSTQPEPSTLAVAVESDSKITGNEETLQLPEKNDTVEETIQNPATFKVTFGKDTKEITMSSNSTVKDLKIRLESETGVTVALQKLLFKGVLKDENTLEDSKVKDNVKIVMMGSKAEDVLKVATTVPTTQKHSQYVIQEKTYLSDLTEHQKILSKGIPDDADVGVIGKRFPLPSRGLWGLLNSRGVKTRLTFKDEIEELWIGTSERTQKVSYHSIKSVTTEAIKGKEEYHIMALQLGPTEKSKYYLYYVPAQFVESEWFDMAKQILLNSLLGITATLLLYNIYVTLSRKRNRKNKSEVILDGVEDLIGDTPLIKINSLSKLTGCEILGKAEFLNPGGSSKDRVALYIVKDAEKKGLIKPFSECTLYEGTVGSTGVALALIARLRGYNCHIVMPDDQSQEKYALLEKYNATIEKVRPVSIIDPNHFVNIAKRRSQQSPNSIFCNQFENLANCEAHFETTGPEIFRQVGGKLDAFVMGAGTGGTLSGVSMYLKPRIPGLKVVLADPQGSGLFNKIKHNVMYSPTESEGSRKRYQVDTVVEGIGINRMTRNFMQGREFVNDAVRVTDQEAVDMARYVMKWDGLFIGSSTAVNLVAAVNVAKELGPVSF